jgi:hypothetical protein
VNWVWAAITAGSLAGFVLGSSVLLRRPGVALPGLLGGLIFALVSLAMTGFTFYEVTGTITTFQENLILMIGVPLAVGAAGTLWGRDAAVGRRIARLTAVSSGLVLYLYSTLAVAVLGAGGPPDNPGRPAAGHATDRDRRMGRSRRHRLAPWRLTCTDAPGAVHLDRKPRHRRGGVIR